MSSTDYLRLNNHKIFKELRESLPKNINKTMNLVVVHDNVLFSWDFQNNCVLTLNLKAARGKQGDNVIHQKLLPLHPPLFSPEFLIVNDTGTLLAIAGPCGILVLELPHKSPPYGAFENNKEVIYCRTHSLDERLLSCGDTVEVRQVKFHPGSLNHNHILVLTSDNMLRLYQVENGQATNLDVYSVGERPSTLFPGTNTPFLAIYGEVAVDFDFGHPEICNVPAGRSVSSAPPGVWNAQTQTIEWKKGEKGHENAIDWINPKTKSTESNDNHQTNKDWNNLVWPIFVLRSDMSVYCIDIDLKKRWKPVLKGPLPMVSFESETIEACSIICLNTVPQIACIALSNGTVWHSICLDTDETTKSEGYKKSLKDLSKKEFLAFESIELELGLATCEEDNDTKYKCPVNLKKDDSKPGRYYATHTAGVHSVAITCADTLQEFINSPEDADPTSDIFVNLSKAEYLLCTKTAASEKSNPVIGFALYYEPTSIITLLGDGSLVTLGVMYTGGLPKLEDLVLDDEPGKTSPLKKMLQEPFEQYIEKILKKTPTQPVLKLPANSTGSQEENYELLQRAAKVFREEYFKNHQKAREELEKRVHTLNMMKQNQQKELMYLTKERDELQEKASNLAEKYEDIKDKQDELLKKAENLLMLVSRKKSAPSEAEKEFVKELNDSSEKIGIFGDKIEKIKNKTKYQQIQMENWKSQEIKKISSLNETHTNTIKSNLQETTKKITDMIKQVNEFKKQLQLK
ncbi:unnamed protein product [Phyllotreta striolata]|uniref:Nuclear pore complex protein Nup88 n=1 Tax=Phyllotreta striolata TaxID=444603 RepID=A0A9N9TVC0_PHYSR|nr:unnamed protein product [Phyllotreta striolata]